MTEYKCHENYNFSMNNCDEIGNSSMKNEEFPILLLLIFINDLLDHITTQSMNRISAYRDILIKSFPKKAKLFCLGYLNDSDDLAIENKIDDILSSCQSFAYNHPLTEIVRKHLERFASIKQNNELVESNYNLKDNLNYSTDLSLSISVPGDSSLSAPNTSKRLYFVAFPNENTSSPTPRSNESLSDRPLIPVPSGGIYNSSLAVLPSPYIQGTPGFYSLCRRFVTMNQLHKSNTSIQKANYVSDMFDASTERYGTDQRDNYLTKNEIELCKNTETKTVDNKEVSFPWSPSSTSVSRVRNIIDNIERKTPGRFFSSKVWQENCHSAKEFSSNIEKQPDIEDTIFHDDNCTTPTNNISSITNDTQILSLPNNSDSHNLFTLKFPFRPGSHFNPGEIFGATPIPVRKSMFDQDNDIIHDLSPGKIDHIDNTNIIQSNCSTDSNDRLENNQLQVSADNNCNTKLRVMESLMNSQDESSLNFVNSHLFNKIEPYFGESVTVKTRNSQDIKTILPMLSSNIFQNSDSVMVESLSVKKRPFSYDVSMKRLYQSNLAVDSTHQNARSCDLIMLLYPENRIDADMLQPNESNNIIPVVHSFEMPMNKPVLELERNKSLLHMKEENISDAELTTTKVNFDDGQQIQIKKLSNRTIPINDDDDDNNYYNHHRNSNVTDLSFMKYSIDSSESLDNEFIHMTDKHTKDISIDNNNHQLLYEDSDNYSDSSDSCILPMSSNTFKPKDDVNDLNLKTDFNNLDDRTMIPFCDSAEKTKMTPKVHAMKVEKRMHRKLKKIAMKNFEDQADLSGEEEHLSIRRTGKKEASWAMYPWQWHQTVREQQDIDPLSIFGCGVRPILFEEVFKTPDFYRAARDAIEKNGNYNRMPDLLSHESRLDKIKKWYQDKKSCGFRDDEGVTKEEVALFRKRVGRLKDVSSVVWDSEWIKCDGGCDHNSALRQPWFQKLNTDASPFPMDSRDSRRNINMKNTPSSLRTSLCQFLSPLPMSRCDAISIEDNDDGCLPVDNNDAAVSTPTGYTRGIFCTTGLLKNRMLSSVKESKHNLPRPKTPKSVSPFKAKSNMNSKAPSNINQINKLPLRPFIPAATVQSNDHHIKNHHHHHKAIQNESKIFRTYQPLYEKVLVSPNPHGTYKPLSLLSRLRQPQP